MEAHPTSEPYRAPAAHSFSSVWGPVQVQESAALGGEIFSSLGSAIELEYGETVNDPRRWQRAKRKFWAESKWSSCLSADTSPWTPYARLLSRDLRSSFFHFNFFVFRLFNFWYVLLLDILYRGIWVWTSATVNSGYGLSAVSSWMAICRLHAH